MGYLKNLFNSLINKKEEVSKKNPAGLELYSAGQYDLGYAKKKVLLKEMKGWVFACVSAIADEIAQIDIKLYKRKGDDIEEVTESPILDTLYKVNDFTTKFDHFWLTSAYLELTGESPWYLERDSSGVTGIFFLDPSKITPIADSKTLISGYRYEVGLGKKIDIPKENIIFLKFPDPSRPFRGLGTLEAASRSVDVDNYSEEWNSKFFQNSARPDSILNVNMVQMDDEQKESLKHSIADQYKGVEKSNKLMVLFGDMKLEKFSTTQKDMDFLEQQRFTRDKIFGIFRVPKAILSQTEGVNYASAKSANYIFARWTIQPKMERIIEQLNEFYVPMFAGSEEMFLDFTNPIPEDEEIKLKNYTEGIDKWLTTNEVRLAEGLPPVEGGDSIYKPINLIPIDSDMNVPEKTIKVIELKVKDKKEKIVVSKGRINQLNAKNVTKRKIDKKAKEYKDNMKKQVKEMLRKEIYDSNKRIVRWSDKKKLTFWNVKDALSRRFIKPVRDKQKIVFEQQRKKVLKKLNKKKAIKASVDISDLQLNKTEEAVITIAVVMPILEELFKESGDETFKFLGVDMVMDTSTEEIQTLLKAETRKFSNSATKTTNIAIKNQVAEGLKNNESIPKIAKRINGIFDEANRVRSEMIARTETVRYNSAATEQAFIDSGVVEAKEWNVEPDACQFCIPMAGAIVPLRGAFFDKGDEITGTDGGKMTLDYDTTEYPPLHVNCKCQLAPVFIENRSIKNKKNK